MKVMESLGCQTKVSFIFISIFLVYLYPQRNPESVKTKLFFNQYFKSITLILFNLFVIWNFASIILSFACLLNQWVKKNKKKKLLSTFPIGTLSFYLEIIAWLGSLIFPSLVENAFRNKKLIFFTWNLWYEEWMKQDLNPVFVDPIRTRRIFLLE